MHTTTKLKENCKKTCCWKLPRSQMTKQEIIISKRKKNVIVLAYINIYSTFLLLFYYLINALWAGNGQKFTNLSQNWPKNWIFNLEHYWPVQQINCSNNTGQATTFFGSVCRNSLFLVIPPIKILILEYEKLKHFYQGQSKKSVEYWEENETTRISTRLSLEPKDKCY